VATPAGKPVASTIKHLDFSNPPNRPSENKRQFADFSNPSAPLNAQELVAKFDGWSRVPPHLWPRAGAARD
jgi:hypothetical protein